MATNDYIINFSDPLKTPFVIKPFTTNGPIAPDNPGLPVTSVAANTTLLLPGKGLFEYGEFTDENLVHMVEHFAGPTEPVFPIQGQLWFKNDTVEMYVCIDPTQVLFSNRWKKIIISGLISGDLDMNNYKIVNLADATNPLDAVNLQTGDSRYVNASGDTMSGILNMGANRITNVDTPISSGDAVNKLYADSLVGGGPFLPLSGGTMTGSINVGDSGANTNKLYNFYVDLTDTTSAVSIGAGDTRYVMSSPSGSQLMSGTYIVNTGDLTLSPGSVIFGPTVAINAGSNPITNLTNPINPQDAATKSYVDGLISSTSSNVIFNRTIFIGDGATTTYSLTPFVYVAAGNTLSVYVNGVKQLASQVATKFLQIFGPVSLTAATPLAPLTTYEFRIQVDGGAVTPVQITTGVSAPTYNDLINLINSGIFTAYGSQVANTAGQVIISSASILISFASATVGTGSGIEILNGVGPLPLPLFTALGAPAIIPVGPVSISTDYAYEEIGLPFTTATTFQFTVAPSIGDVIEIIIAS